MTSHAQNKEAGVDSGMELLSRWRTTPIPVLEQEISRMTNVNALRTIAFACRGASFPEKAEDIAVDNRLNRIFWASVRALCGTQTDEAKAARRIILESGLVQGGDRILFKSFEERGRNAQSESKKDGAKRTKPSDPRSQQL
jgi:hypothetical protein